MLIRINSSAYLFYLNINIIVPKISTNYRNYIFFFTYYSWHEIGTRDLPAMIDHILETTGQEKLFYLGHSQGTTNFFVMATEVPEYQNKIQAMFAMAPVAYCGRISSALMQLLARLTNSIDVCNSNINRKITVIINFENFMDQMFRCR